MKVLFADVQGIWVQTKMEASADVRIVGTHTLTARLVDYRSEDQVAATPSARGGVFEERMGKRGKTGRFPSSAGDAGANLNYALYVSATNIGIDSVQRARNITEVTECSAAWSLLFVHHGLT